MFESYFCTKTLFEQVLIHFEKHYRRRHSVDYEGYFTSDFKRIIGTYFNGSDTFEMDFKKTALAQSTQSNERRLAQLFSNFNNFFTQQASKEKCIFRMLKILFSIFQFPFTDVVSFKCII